MPILFLGHGSPMNAIEDNSFTRSMKELNGKIPKPKAILMISAHWETKGTWITAMENPKIIYDFYGFPQKLFDVKYPVKGSSDIAKNIQQSIENTNIQQDLNNWGIDHGSWSVLTHLYPDADIPVLQLSLNMNESEDYHYQIGKELNALRHQGILIIGSGNIVHNLRKISWQPETPSPDWALEFDNWVKEKSTNRDFNALINDARKFEAGKLSIPSLEHYLPLLYILGASDKDDRLAFDNEGMQNSSISMRSLRFY